MANLWDFDIIKSEVRGLTMKRSINQLSDEELGNKINQYFFYKFPQEVNPHELHDMYEFETAASTDLYTIDQDVVVAFDGTVYIADTDVIGDAGTVWMDANLFYLTWPPKSTTDENEPTDFLIDSGQIRTIPIPDDTYYIKMPCIIRPTTFSTPTQLPTANGREYEEWGSVIAHGTSVNILEGTGEDDRLQQVRSWYEREKLYLKKRIVFQNSSKRPLCKF